MEKIIITIGRQLGSGGKKIAEKIGFENDGRFYAVDAYKKY